MTKGNAGLSFWLALAAGVVVFGLTWIIGHHIFWRAALFGAIVFLILWAVLAYAFGKGEADKSFGGAASAKPAPTPAGAMPVAAMPAAAAPAAAMPAASSAPAMSAPTMASAAPAPAPKAAPKAAAKPAAKAAAKPAAKAAAKSDAAPGSVGTAPATLAAARGGKADDLKIIEGIGPAMEKLVNSLGFYHYDQIAAWSDDEIAWVDSHMKTFRGRIVRDKWVAQAKLIVSEGVEKFLERAKTNDY